MKKTILITGGAGYIGSHAVVAFEKAGYKTIILDNFSNSDEKNLKGIEKILNNLEKNNYSPKFFNCDLKNFSDVEKIFLEQEKKGEEISGVLHFAGLKAVGESCEKPIKYFENNISGSINLFSCMEKFGVKNLIFSSSATVYDQKIFLEKKFSGAKENNLVGNTTNPYGTAKFLAEKILEDLAKFSNFNVINLRYFNPIGAHKSGFIGEDPRGIPNNLLPFIMKVANGELEKLKIFGGDYETEDGTGKRDYIDVNDLIDGHLKAYEKLEKLNTCYSHEDKNLKAPQVCHSREGGNPLSCGFCEAYNLGTGKSVSVLEMVKKSEKISGKNISYEIVERRSGDLGDVFCDPKKAEKELGWKAKISLEESLENSWRFYCK